MKYRPGILRIGCGLGFFFQNNTYFQTILLVSIISKLFSKLISRDYETEDHYSKSSITGSISMKIHLELEF